jgi:hypothetical protein
MDSTLFSFFVGEAAVHHDIVHHPFSLNWIRIFLFQGHAEAVEVLCDLGANVSARIEGRWSWISNYLGFLQLIQSKLYTNRKLAQQHNSPCLGMDDRIYERIQGIAQDFFLFADVTRFWSQSVRRFWLTLERMSMLLTMLAGLLFIARHKLWDRIFWKSWIMQLVFFIFNNNDLIFPEGNNDLIFPE